MPHPLVLRRASVTNPAQIRANAYLAGLQRPFVPERQMTRGPGVRRRACCTPGPRPSGRWPSPEVAERYADAMALPFVAHSAAEYYRWVVRSQLRLDGRRFARRLRGDVRVPVLYLQGDRDGAVAPSSTRGSAAYVTGRYEEHVIAGAGHFLPEEAPEAVNAHLIRWLDRLG